MLLTFFLINFLGIIQCNPHVETLMGPIKGTFQVSYRGRNYSAFKGIPYAKPPIGELRFREPHRTEKWENDLFANAEYMCTSFFPFPDLWGVRGHENCLYLYIYVPRQEINPAEKLDVVVHIHEGAFMMGSPNLYAGPQYIMDTDVIFVTFNYRLGILGFLSTEDNVVPGNNGLKDQVMALTWIKENIQAFGGNPDSITLTGLFAGASSVHYHYLSPLSKGLFNRGFSQSGTALQHSALVENPLEKAEHVALKLGCTTHSTKEMVHCLRLKSARKLVMAVTSLFVLNDVIPVTPFGPVIETKGHHTFLPEHPYKLMTSGKILDVPWVTSNAKNEGIFPIALFVLTNKLVEFDHHWDHLLPYALDFEDTVDDRVKNQVSEKIRNYYYHRQHVLRSNVENLVELFSERTLVDTEKALRIQAGNNNTVYYYYFTYDLQEKLFVSETIKGVTHTDDGKLFLRMAHTPNSLSDTDETMMTYFVNFIANYAKTGIPSFNGIEWKPIDPNSNEINYLHIGSPKDISMKSKRELGPTEFWNSLPIMENEKLFEDDDFVSM